jgi:ribosomal protein S18 acetylase RimI-like enzyme
MPYNAWDDLHLDEEGEGLRLRWARDDDFEKIRTIILDPTTLAAVQATPEEADRNIHKLWEGDPHDSEMRHMVAEVAGHPSTSLKVNSDPALHRQHEIAKITAYLRLLFPFPQPPQMEPQSLWLSYFAVAPELRGQGYGGRIMRMLVQAARNAPQVKLFGLHTSSYNAAAIRLYETVGFACVRREPWPSFVVGREGVRVTMVIEKG